MADAAHFGIVVAPHQARVLEHALLPILFATKEGLAIAAEGDGVGGMVHLCTCLEMIVAFRHLFLLIAFDAAPKEIHLVLYQAWHARHVIRKSGRESDIFSRRPSILIQRIGRHKNDLPMRHPPIG